MKNKKEKLSILQVNSSDRGGGAESSAWNLFQSYQKLGHSSWLAVGRKFTKNPNVFRIPLSSKKMVLSGPEEIFRCWIEEMISLKVPGALKFRLWYPRLLSIKRMADWYQGREECYRFGSNRLLELIPDQVDLIHCHNLHGAYFDISSLIPISRKVPVILNLRDMWPLTGHCAHSFLCIKWQSGCGECPSLNTFPSIRRDSTRFNWKKKADTYKQCKLHIVGNSNWTLNCAKKSMLNGCDYKVIENGIDLTCFKPVSSRKKIREGLGIPADLPVIMFAANSGKNSPWRDWKLMEHSLRIVACEVNIPIIFLCLGGGTIQHKKQVGKVKTIYVPFVSNPKVLANYYQSADIYLHAALAESSGKTITEALACGVPVVATSIGGIPEQVFSGVNGFLVESGGATAMAKLILKLISDKALREKMAGNAASSVKRFDIQVQISSFIDYYYTVIDKFKSAI